MELINPPIQMKPEDGFPHRFKYKLGQEVILVGSGLQGFILCRSDHGSYNMYRVFCTAEGTYLDDFFPEHLLVEVKPKPVKKSK